MIKEELKIGLDTNLHNLHIVDVDGHCYKAQQHQQLKKIKILKQNSKKKVFVAWVCVTFDELLSALKVG